MAYTSRSERVAAGQCLVVIALVLLLTAVDNVQARSGSTSDLVRSKRAAGRQGCIQQCMATCRSYTFDCWGGLCAPCTLICPLSCGFSRGTSDEGYSPGPATANLREDKERPALTLAAAGPPGPPQAGPAGPAAAPARAPTQGKKKKKKRRGRRRKGKGKKGKKGGRKMPLRRNRKRKRGRKQKKAQQPPAQ